MEGDGSGCWLARVRAALRFVLRFQFLEHGVEPLEGRFPVLAVAVEPRADVPERVAVEAADVGAPDDAAPDEACLLEHAHVLGRGRERHLERRREFAQVPFPRFGELAEHRTPRGVRKGVENAVERGRAILNHRV